MADEEQTSIRDEAQALQQEVETLQESVSNSLADMSETELLDYLYYMWMIWGDFQLYIIDPLIEPIFPTNVIAPKQLEDGRLENVFDIHDEGFRLATSRGPEGIALGHSMLKFYNTIEKMVAILVERINADAANLEPDAEIRVAFYGHELAQRKAFESILNLQENVVVTNFDPGEWGERYMNTVLTMVEQGYGTPNASPRKTYRGPDS